MIYGLLDHLAGTLERPQLQLSRWLRAIPALRDRKGGTHTRTEWAYTAGLFQATFHFALEGVDAPRVLDVGCGTGRLALAWAPLLGAEGRYVGLDVDRAQVERCRRRLDDPAFSFVHLDQRNRAYAPGQPDAPAPYPFEDAGFDAVSALSVWTHLNEDDATFALREVARVLRPGGRAIVSFFLLDDDYEAFRDAAPDASAFSLRDPRRWIFDRATDGSEDFRHPSWARVPESAIGVTPAGLERLAAASGMRVEAVHPGQWKERPGLFFQDVVVFGRAD